MADGALPVGDALAEVLADVRRYLGWHRDVAGEELHASMDGALGAIAAAMSVEVSVEGSSTPPVVVEYAEASTETGAEALVQPAATGTRAPVMTAAAPEPALARSSDEPPRLDEVRKALGDCKRCKLCSGRKNLVFGVGNPKARLVFVGEGPGAEEDNQGIPFVGRAGQLLTKIIEAIGLKREDVYIANVIKCRPPQNRNPEPDEVEKCEPFLFQQIDIIKPKVIVALGKFGAQTLLRTLDPISRLRGRVFDYRGAKLIPTFHPAYLLRNPSSKRDVWEDMKLVLKLLTES